MPQKVRRPSIRLRLDRRRLPTGASPQGNGPWNFVGKPDHPVYSGGLALRNTAQGLDQRFFDNAGRKLKVGADDTLVCLCLYRSQSIPRESSCSSGTRTAAGPTARTGARTDRRGEPMALPSGSRSAACPPQKSGCGWKCLLPSSSSSPAQSSTAGHLPSTAGPSTGTRPASKLRLPRRPGL